jgi:hypothetical protein
VVKSSKPVKIANFDTGGGGYILKGVTKGDAFIEKGYFVTCSLPASESTFSTGWSQKKGTKLMIPLRAFLLAWD